MSRFRFWCSDVFVAPFPSNMADLVVGERVYTRRTGQVLAPEDRKELTRLLDDADLSEDGFAAQVRHLYVTCADVPDVSTDEWSI